MSLDAPPLNAEVAGVDKQFSAAWKRSLNQLYANAKGLSYNPVTNVLTLGLTPLYTTVTAASATRIAGVAPATLHTDDTYDGYTIAQVVKALRNLGVLA
jgi:hypothetical protein